MEEEGGKVKEIEQSKEWKQLQKSSKHIVVMLRWPQ